MTKSFIYGALGISLLAADAPAAVHHVDWSGTSFRGYARPVDSVEGAIRLLPSGRTARVARVEIPADETIAAVTLTNVAEVRAATPTPRLPEVELSLGAPAGTANGYDYWILPDGFFRGRRIAHVLVHTTREVGDETRLLSGFALDITTRPAADAPIRRRVAHEAAIAADEVTLHEFLDTPPLPGPALDDTQGRGLPPEMNAEPLEYVIITTAALAPALQTLADQKTKEGMPAAITTLEWIQANYNGIDLPARMRAYLSDAWRYKGLRYALLAGDTDVVPQRITVNRYQAPQGAELTSEIYFACFDGDYNADGDDLLGEGTDLPEEIGDQVDFYHEIAVSRIPINDTTEANTFINKWRSYTGYNQVGFRTDYQNKALFLGEVLFPAEWTPGDDPNDIALDGAELCQNVLPYMTGFSTTRMYQYYNNPAWPGAIPEIRTQVISQINSGYGIVNHVGHGFRTNMSVGDGKLVNSDADAFTNNKAFSVMYAANCNSGAVAYDSISEHLLLNPVGGVVACVSSTDLDYPYAADDFKYRWFEDVFTGAGKRLADAFYDANLPSIAVAQLNDNSIRWTIMALICQGDPALDIWRGTPKTLTVQYTGTYDLSASSMSVTVTESGVPVPDATICIYKTDGYGVAKTNGAGVAVVPFLPETTGQFTLTATKNTYVPRVLSGSVVAPSTAALRIESLAFHDGTAGGGSGNADGRPDAGESIVVDLVVRNDGSVASTNNTVVMHANSSFVSVSDSTASPATTNAGTQRTVTGAFAFTVDAAWPDSMRQARIPATFDITSLQGSATDEHPFSVYQRLLQITGLDVTILNDDGDGVLENGETASIDLTVQNEGLADAIDVTGVASVGGSFVMVDDTINFGTIAAGQEVTQGAFEVLSTGGTAGDLVLSLALSDTYSSGLLTRSIDIVAPATPGAIDTDPQETSIRLVWARSATDVRGHRVYRSTNEGGPFTEITSGIVPGGAYFVDEGLPALTRYFYTVAAVDSSGNMSAQSAPVEASTSPPSLEGFPVPLPSGLSQGSPTIYDFDTDGMPEILLGWNYPIVVRGDGSEYIDGDENAITLGVFSTVGNGEDAFWTKPAVADLDGDGVNEAVFTTFEVSSDGMLYVLDETGAMEPGWPRTISKLQWSTPAVGDVDGVPGMEIFLTSGANSGTYQGTLLGFHHDGTEVRDGDNNPATIGIFRKGPVGAQYMYGSVALAPIGFGGGARDIVYLEKTQHATPSQSRLFVFDANGTIRVNFPYGTGVLKGSTSSPAVADLNGDGQQEMIIVTEDRIDVVQYTGQSLPGWPRSLPAIPSDQTAIKDYMSSPAVGDVNLDGKLDIVLGWLDGIVYAWRGDTGNQLAGFPYNAQLTGSLPYNRYMRSPIIGNVDGDPNPEILVGTGDAQLVGINHDGTTVAGFPLQLEGNIHGSPALGDTDGDGYVNLVVQTDAPQIEVYDFGNVPYVAAEHPWPMFRHNAKNDGTYRTPSAVDVETPELVPQVAAVHAPFPNPFTAQRVEVPFDVPEGGDRVVIRVFDVGGREVRRLADGTFPGGRFRIQWDGRTERGEALAPGVYFTRVEIGGRHFLRKLTMLR